MNHMIRTILLIAAILLGGACNRDEKADRAFLKSDTPTLKVDGKVIIKYREALHQMGYSAAQKKFWLGTDNLSDYYIVTFSDKFPTAEGQSVKGTLVYTTKDSEKSLKNLNFKVEKASGDGQFWLWNSEEKVAVTVFALEP